MNAGGVLVRNTRSGIHDLSKCTSQHVVHGISEGRAGHWTDLKQNMLKGSFALNTELLRTPDGRVGGEVVVLAGTRVRSGGYGRNADPTRCYLSQRT